MNEDNVIDIHQQDTAIVKHTQQADLMTRFQPQNFADLRDFADVVVASEICGVKSPADAMVIMMTGAELGLSVMQSLRGIHVINGKPTLAADAMGAIVKRSTVCEYLRIVEMSAERCVLETQRHGEPEPVRMEWTLDDARRAKLSSQTWSKYPQAMLKSRCMAQMCRAVYPDVIAGLYDPDEIEGIEIRETPETKKGTVQAGAADRLWSLVLEAVGEERALVWRGHYLAGLGCEELWDVPTKKLDKMHAVIRKAPDAAAYIETCIERAEAKQADEEETVEAKAKQLADKTEGASAKRDANNKSALLEELGSLLSCVTPSMGDKFIVVYVERVQAQNNNSVEIHTLEDVDARKLGAIVRRLRGMSDEDRSNYIEGVIADATGVIDEANESEIDKALAEDDHGRWLEANRAWYGAASEPFLQGVKERDEKAAKRQREKASEIVEQFRAQQKQRWGVKSSKDLDPADYMAKAEQLADMPVDARRDFIQDQIAQS